MSRSLFSGSSTIDAGPSTRRPVSSTLNSECATSGSLWISRSVSPTISGRIAAARANSTAARRSAALVMTLTWFAPSCLMALVTWRRRLTTFSSICPIMPASRKWTLRM